MTTAQQPTTLRDYLQLARRRLWIILAVAAIGALAAAFFSARQNKLYRASATVLISGFDSAQPPDMFMQTQADIATSSPEVARRVRNVLHLRTTPSVEVTPKTNSDLLEFSSKAPDPRLAARIATTYAEQFSSFRAELGTAGIRRSLAAVNKAIAALQVAGVSANPVRYRNLLARQAELETLQASQNAQAVMMRPAISGAQVQPRTVRNTVLGLVFGLILGCGLAFLRDALDTRVRSTDEIGELLGLPLLARLPQPPAELSREYRLVMVTDPDGLGAEGYKILRANVEFARMQSEATTLLVTSARDGDGKTTTVANLAVALARAGQRVILVDLDLRRPSLHEFFGLRGPGVAQVATGAATLDEALAPIPLVWPGSASWRDEENALPQPAGGLLEVLPAGPLPERLDDVLAKNILVGILDALRRRADVVLVDSTPLLAGDAIATSAAVDAIAIVVKINVRRQILRELRRVIDSIPTSKIGFIAAGAEFGANYSGGVGTYRRPARTRDLVR